MNTSTNWSVYVSSARLFVISTLVIFNGAALWKVISHPKASHGKQINKLAVISILVVNLAYLSLVWAPFTIGSFRHDLMADENDFSSQIKQELPSKVPMAIVEELHNRSTHQRQRRLAKIETTEEHRGTWAIVFPTVPLHRNMENEIREPLPIFLNVNCGFQDCITSSCCYSLAFIAVIKLILTNKPLSLPMGGLALTGYTSLLTGVPFLATLAIRYAEQVGSKYSPHEPEKSSNGYTFYNIICDAQVSNTFVFLSFLEWAGLMMVLLLTVTSFLGVSTKTDINHRYSNHFTFNEKLSTFGKLSINGGHYTRDIVLSLGALWSWPLKPCAILLAYVVYGKHWTNNISWISHTIATSSVIFVSLATLICSRTFADCVNELDDTRSSRKKLSRKSFSEGLDQSPTLIISSSRHRDERPPPSYEEYSRKYSSQINEEDEENQPSSAVIKPDQTSKCAQDIKNSLERLDLQTAKKYILNLSVNDKREDTKIILNHSEEHASFSEV